MKSLSSFRRFNQFTLIELLVKRSHLCCDRVYGKEEGLSPAQRAGEAVQLHLNRASCSNRHHCNTCCHAAARAAAGKGPGNVNNLS